MYTADELEQASRIVYAAMPPTPQYAWPLLAEATGCETWVKHENHTPTGAFKVRGGLVHMKLRKDRGETGGVITATRGNHGQSIPFAAARVGIRSTIVCPVGNSPEKNAAMRALGAELIETGHDFDAARETAMEIAKERGLDFIPSFGKELVMGVTTYAHELFRAAGELDAVYVPIGMGSGIVGTIAARDMLGLKTKVIGVVAEGANAIALSFAAGKPVSTNTRLHLRRRHGGARGEPGGLRPHPAGRRPHRDGERRRDRRGHAPLFPLLPHHRRGCGCRTARRADAGARRDEGQARGRHPVRRQHRHAEIRRGAGGQDAGVNVAVIPAFAGTAPHDRAYSDTDSPPSTASTWPFT